MNQTRPMPVVLIHKLANQMIEVLIPKYDELAQALVFDRLNKAFAAFFELNENHFVAELISQHANHPIVGL